MVYRLPTDSDGVKYHGIVDADGENPGQVLYGVDEHGNYRPVKVDTDGNVLTQVTGSNTELIEVWEDFDVPSNATRKLGYVDVSDYKEFYVHVVPGQLNNYTLYRYIRRFDGPDLSRSKIMDRENSANTSSERFKINSIFSTIGVENKTDTDQTFSKIWFFGVKS